VIFATNWGVSAHFGSVDNVKNIIMEFLEPKGQLVVNKAMFRNAMRIYNIRRRYLR
jgi:predicted TIM-barrel fold metal-dependent hydrolase